jgi:hypothetical protein
VGIGGDRMFGDNDYDDGVRDWDMVLGLGSGVLGLFESE